MKTITKPNPKQTSNWTHWQNLKEGDLRLTQLKELPNWVKEQVFEQSIQCE